MCEDFRLGGISKEVFGRPSRLGQCYLERLRVSGQRLGDIESAALNRLTVWHSLFYNGSDGSMLGGSITDGPATGGNEYG